MESSNTQPLPSGHSSLLKLPAELRYEIYDYLGPWEHKSYPFGRLIVSSIDRRAPPTALIATCRYLHDDILNHFYNTATICTAPQIIPGDWPAYADAITTLALRRIKKMELRLYWHDRHKKLSSQELYADAGTCLNSMIVFLQREAKNLRTITVSLSDILSVDWEINKRLLEPLKDLVPRVVLRLGEVIGLDDEKEARLRELLQLHLDALNETLPQPVEAEDPKQAVNTVNNE
ncbi:hypothetical protein yc1106_01589 [Curvularia clavata]|uniref:F-box domain-containing protein n=1 Tax=Curvularia clavata TaxID=95742 RepID=A0A9Q8Z370_CURCL|nr:hypothetical protein yc1106_01589 [Curvularia clavata]